MSRDNVVQRCNGKQVGTYRTLSDDEDDSLPVKPARKLDAASERSKRSPEVLAREAIAEKLSYMEWKEKVTQAGEPDLRRRRIVATEELLATLNRQRQARAKSRSKAA